MKAIKVRKTDVHISKERNNFLENGFRPIQSNKIHRQLCTSVEAGGGPVELTDSEMTHIIYSVIVTPRRYSTVKKKPG